MDGSDRTRPEPIDVPEELLPVLRAAAEYGLELAADNGAGDWNDAIRGGILSRRRTNGRLAHPHSCGPSSSASAGRRSAP
jgi:hypothetical protein